MRKDKKEIIEEKTIVKEVIEDFKRRAEERKSFDIIWKINMNFLMGFQAL